MAKGFRFTTLSLVRLRAFWLSTWVSLVQTLKQVLPRARAGGRRCHSDVTKVRDETGDGVRVTSRTGSVQRFMENWKNVRELNTRRQTKRFDFCSSQTRGELAPYGGRSRWGPNEYDIIEDCVSPPYVETFNTKLIKRFRTWTRSRYVFSNFEIPMFFICSIVLYMWLWAL